MFCTPLPTSLSPSFTLKSVLFAASPLCQSQTPPFWPFFFLWAQCSKIAQMGLSPLGFSVCLSQVHFGTPCPFPDCQPSPFHSPTPPSSTIPPERFFLPWPSPPSPPHQFIPDKQSFHSWGNFTPPPTQFPLHMTNSYVFPPHDFFSPTNLLPPQVHTGQVFVPCLASWDQTTFPIKPRKREVPPPWGRKNPFFQGGVASDN